MTYGWEYNDNPFQGYDLVAEDCYWDYEWDITVVLHRHGQFFTASDSGCSCNGPWEYEVNIEPVGSFAEAVKGLSPEAKEQALKWKGGA